MAQILGEVDLLIRNVRRLIGEREPGEWEDYELIDAANQEAEQIFMKILDPAGAGYGVRSADITFVADQERYDLPYGFLRLCEPSVQDTDGNHMYDNDVLFRSERGLRDGVWIENNQLGVAPIPAAAESNALKLFYVSRPVPIHKGEAQAVAAASITLAKTVTLGSVLTRNNAYLGAKVQALDCTTNEGEIATITAYTGSTHVATVAWTNTPTGTVTYEVMPDLPEEARGLWLVKTAIRCLTDHDAGSASKLNLLMRDAAEMTNTLRHVANDRAKTRTAQVWQDDLLTS